VQGRATVDDLLAEARSGLWRLTAQEAYDAVRAGALLIDTRTETQRRAVGDIPGAVCIDRTVLEWRLDPASGSRIEQASYDRKVVVLCRQGYSSSLAAASLRRLGLDATDVIGGVEAWLAAELPIVAAAG
jgi:rhodanese-related sulfurtransferase